MRRCFFRRFFGIDFGVYFRFYFPRVQLSAAKNFDF